jgi:hypothetical protein
LNVHARLERQQRLERERAVLQMRHSVVAAIAPAHIERVGSSAVLEAVDEALAQIVATGAHLGDADEVRALWITAARRRIIDEERSARSRHRGERPRATDAAPPADAFHERGGVTDEARQRWRIREIFSVLRGDQRRWAEAWYDEILSSSRVRGVQPRGLSDALGWTPAKTKSVSRRARAKMATFIEARASGAVCAEQQAQLDGFILAATRGSSVISDEHCAAVLFHVAGCEDCRAVWHARRRELLRRGVAVVMLPLDAVATAAQACGVKLVGFAAGAHAQASAMLTRAGIGGAAAAGGGVATLSGKTAAACLGVVCAAAAGGEVAVVLSPTTREAPPPARVRAARVHRAEPAAASAVQRSVAPAAAPAVDVKLKTEVRRTLTAPTWTEARATLGDLPPGGVSASPTSSRPSPAFAAPRSGAAPAFAAPRSGAAPAFAAPRSGARPCTPGSLGC